MFNKALLLFTIACDPTKVEEGDSAGETGGEDPAEESSPYERDSRAGCTYNLEYDEGSEGEVDWTESYTWDAREDEEGDTEAVEYHYDHIDGDSLHQTTTWGDVLWCSTARESEGSTDGEAYAYRYSASCDEHAAWTSRDYEERVDGDWQPYKVETYVNTYDGDQLVERERSTDYADEEITDDVWRYVWTYSGELLTRQDVYINTELYYWAELDYDDDGNVLEQAIYLGSYFGYDEEDRELYSMVTYTWDERSNLLTRDMEYPSDGGVGEHEIWTWDEHDRITTHEFWTDDEAEHYLSSPVWDEEHYRYLEYAYEDFVDETASYTNTYTYSGGWPWSGTGVSTFSDGVTADNSFSFSYSCP